MYVVLCGDGSKECIVLCGDGSKECMQYYVVMGEQ